MFTELTFDKPGAIESHNHHTSHLQSSINVKCCYGIGSHDGPISNVLGMPPRLSKGNPIIEHLSIQSFRIQLQKKCLQDDML